MRAVQQQFTEYDENQQDHMKKKDRGTKHISKLPNMG